MLFDIHTVMQDTDNLNLVFSSMTVKNDMFTNPILEIVFPDIITRPAQTGLVRQIMKRAIQLSQIVYLLGLSSLFASITTDGKQIAPGFLRKDERSHLFFTF